MEYGLTKSLKIYSGGLGILAGDYLKQASDSNANMLAIGLLYRYGYFAQDLSVWGEQLSQYIPQNFSYLPMEPVCDENGEKVIISIAFPGRSVYARAWRVPVGRISLYLLDTDIDENSPEDRGITGKLYGGDSEMRIKQEMFLGIGGYSGKEKKMLMVSFTMRQYSEMFAVVNAIDPEAFITVHAAHEISGEGWTR